MNNDFFKTLSSCVLFKGLSENEIRNAIENIKHTAFSYSKGQTVAIEDDECSSLGIVIKGSIEIQKSYASGKTVTIDTLETGNIFGEVIIFSEMHKYPATIISSSNMTQILFISKEHIILLCSLDSKILKNFMGILSNKILMLNKKIKSLSYQTIRQKISNYIIEEYKRQKNVILTAPCSRKEMAEQLGIPRPSLSRELIFMKEDGLIDFDKNTIKILDLDAIENELL